MDDPVPGYTKTRQRLTQLEVGLFDLRDEFSAAVSETHEQSVGALTELSKRLQDTLHRIHNFFEMRERLVAVYSRQSRDYADSCATLITKYRDINLANRDNVPCPHATFVSIRPSSSMRTARRSACGSWMRTPGLPCAATSTRKR